MMDNWMQKSAKALKSVWSVVTCGKKMNAMMNRNIHSSFVRAGLMNEEIWAVKGAQENKLALFGRIRN